MRRFPLAVIPLLCAVSALPAAETVNITVYPYSGDGPANLVSNALPFRPGALFDASNVRVMDGASEVPVAAKVLAHWPQDNSIRSVLLQFSAPFTTASKTYTIEIGNARQTADRTFTSVTWDLPTRIFTLPASYLSESLFVWEQKPLGQTGFPAWDSKQLSYYSRIETVGTAACVRDDQYYDAITTTYQLYARTGDLKYLVNARRWALHHRRDQIYLDGSYVGHPKCSSAYINNTRYTFPQGLISDYFMFGDEEDKRVSGLVVDNFYMPHDPKFYYLAPNTRGWWTEREAAFSIIGTLAHYEGTNNSTYINKVKERVASLRQMQVDNGRRAWVHNLYDHDPSEGCATTDWGSSPWMSGLLLEGIIEYHKLTGDPVAKDSILMALDDLKARYLATGSYAGKSFVYLGCSIYKDGQPDLDNLISHAYAYGYAITGNQAYLKVATDIFNTAVSYGVLSDHKHYDQQFRSSGHSVAYLAGDSGTTPPPPSNSDTSPPAVTVDALPAVVGGVITITAQATDNVGVAGVQFLIDGTAWGGENTSSPYSVQVDTNLLSSGSHTVTARARDAAGNTATSVGVSFIVDNGRPVVAITSPAAGAAVGDSFTATASVTDRNAIAGVQFLLDGAAWGAEDTSSPWSVLISTAQLSSGTHTIAARARDVAGNVGTSAAVSFVVDRDNPVVTITSPAPNTIVGNTFTAAATVTDSNGVAGVQFKIDNQNYGNEITSPPYSLTVSASGLADGDHTLSAVARDIAGHQGLASIPFRVQRATPPPQPPPLSVDSVVNGATYGANLACSPNTLVTVFGTNLTSGGSESAAVVPLPSRMQGVSVKANGVSLPLLYVSPGQINVECPDSSPGQSLSLTVERDGLASAPVQVAQKFAVPGIFSLDSSGKGQGAILIGNTDQLAMPATFGIPSRPVVPGEYVSIFATGLGPVTGYVAPGAAAVADEAALIAPIQVTIGGIPADVSYAGLAPGWVGLYQVNARVPDSVAPGDAVPVVIKITNPDATMAASNTVTMSVRLAR